MAKAVREYMPLRGTDRAIDHTRCRAHVCTYIGLWPNFHQCRNKAKYDGKWCGVHRPEATSKKETTS